MERSTSSALAAPASGQYCAMSRATGLIRLGGITLPGNGVRMYCPGRAGSGRVVSGSKIVTPLCEKSPLCSRLVGDLTTASSIVLDL